MTVPTTKPRVLAIGYPTAAVDKLAELSSWIDFVHVEQLPREESKLVVKKAVAENEPFDAVALLTDFSKPHSMPLAEDNTSYLCDAGVKLIAGLGAGFDKVDHKYLSSRKCYYANSPKSVALRVADATAMTIQMAIRAFTHQDASVRAGGWLDRSVIVKDARKCTLGIIGMGRVGSQIAAHMKYFGMKVNYHNRNPLETDSQTGFTYLSMDDLLATSDVVVLSCPLNEETKGLVSAKEISKMKDNVIIVSCTRGAIMDEDALIAGLESGKVLRCALDNFNNEPTINPYFIKSTKVTISPHCAAINETLSLDLETEMLENLESFFKTGKPLTPVNKW